MKKAIMTLALLLSAACGQENGFTETSIDEILIIRNSDRVILKIEADGYEEAVCDVAGCAYNGDPKSGNCMVSGLKQANMNEAHLIITTSTEHYMYFTFDKEVTNCRVDGEIVDSKLYVKRGY